MDWIALAESAAVDRKMHANALCSRSGKLVSCMTSHQQWTFGDISMRRVIESEAPLLSPFEIFPDCTQAHLDANRDWLVPRFQDAAGGLLTITIQSFLLRRNGLTILVDSCSGNDKEARTRPQFRRAQWPWLARLAEAGVRPEHIDIVLCSHLHVDHVGWNTRLDNGRWVPTFPKARYLIGRREWAHWQAAGPAALVRTGDYITDSVLPVFEAGQAELIGDDQAILSADLMHHPLQVRYPDWSTRFCTDPDAARRTRIGFFNAHAGTGRLIFPAHFPTPTGGMIERDGRDFRFTFCGEDHACFGGG
jgi:glyoxylase-like metal-dependent hydrolase (beta-lactamase superfamily II)